MDETVVIIGAGPAGSTLAHLLASKSINVILFDHKAPWDKPCGGMLRPGIFDDIPILQDYPFPVRHVDGIVYASPGDDRRRVKAEKPVPIISRIELSRFLLGLAIKSGADFRPEKVVGLRREGSRWIVETSTNRLKVNLIVGADGVHSVARKATVGKFHKNQLVLACGYVLDELSNNEDLMRFLDIEGYLWVFSRPDYVSAGIGARLGTIPAGRLFRRLDEFLDENYPVRKASAKYVAIIPMASDRACFDTPCCGENWILVGDAAGHVDPIIGEGIYFAFASAELAARAVLNQDIPSFDQMWRENYGGTLRQRAQLSQMLSTLAGSFSAEAVAEMVFRLLVE
jgi:geranylgeranyl reductase family protein